MGVRYHIFILLTLAVAGCATQSGDRQTAGRSATLSDPTAATSELYAQYAEWEGTRYRFGGTSKDGIDCSGFTYVTFKKRFGIRLPRTTAQQVELGVQVPRNALRPGDLVFFRTGDKTRHVGIYTGGRKFLHASTSRGVILSSLDNPYWRARFWKARRLGGYANTPATS